MQDKHSVILVLYVDELIITWNNEAHIKHVKEELQVDFKIIDLGPLHYYLGVELIQHENQVFLSKTKYVNEILKKFGMEDCKPSFTPMEKNLKLSKGVNWWIVQGIGNWLETLFIWQILD